MDRAMDQRRFRALGVAGVLILTMALNAKAMYAAFFGNYSVEYVLARYVAALLVGYVGMRIMESILFRPHHPEPTADESNTQKPVVNTPVE